MLYCHFSKKNRLREYRRKIPVWIMLLMFCMAGMTANVFAETYDGYPPSPGWVRALPSADTASQMLTVVGEDVPNAAVSLHEKDSSGTWREILSTYGYIGREGIGKTEEGDALTPAGVFHFTEAFGIEPDPGCEIPYHQVDEYDYWSCDQRPGYAYNHLVNLADYPDLDTESSEHLIDCTGFYEYCLNISWNEEGVPGMGSAIFLHCINPDMPYTEGCVAIPEEDMIQVMQRVHPDCVVIIDTYQELRSEK